MTAFPYVISILILTFKRYEAGIFCNECRSQKSIKHAVISLLFGIWGIPFGIIYTLESLIVNFQKGKQPREENQELLRQLALVNAVLGKISEAKSALKSLLKLGKDDHANEFLYELNNNYPTIAPARISGLRFGFITIVAVVLAAYSLIATAILGDSQGTTIPASPPPVKSTPATTFEPVPTRPPQSTPILPSQPVSLEPPDDSFVFWLDNSGWVSETTVEIVGDVRNAHHKWTITNVTVTVEMLDKYGKVIQRETVSVIPSTLPPGYGGKYSRTIRVSTTCQDGSTELNWDWEPP